MAQDDASIKVGLEDKASGPLKQLTDNVKKFAGEFEKATPHVAGANASILRFATGIAVGNIAVLAARKIIGDFSGAIHDVINAAEESQRVMTQTNAVIASTGGIAGITADGIANMAAEIQKTTPISDEAAQAGMNMLLTFQSIGKDIFPQATQALIDTATAMNGGVTPSAGQLIDTAKQLGFALNDPIEGMSRLRRQGVTFSEDQEKLIKHLVNTNQGMEAQKVILTELASEFGGSASAQLGTFAGRMLQTQNEINDLQEKIGFALMPAVTILADTFSKFAVTANGTVSPALNNIAKFLSALASAFLIAIQVATRAGSIIVGVVSNIGKSLSALGKADLEGFKKGVSGAFDSVSSNVDGFNKDFQSQMLTLGKTFEQIETQGVKSFGNLFTDKNGREIAQRVGDTMKKIADAILKENRDFAEAVQKQVATYNESLKDLVLAHKDKVSKIQEQLDGENSDFKDQMDQRVASFNKAMADIEKRHLDKVKTISDQIKAEQTKTQDALKAVDDKYKDQLIQFKRAGQERIDSLQGQLDKELAKGKYTDNQKIKSLESMLERERIALGEQVAVREGIIQDEKDQVAQEHQAKLDSLTEELKTENQAVIDASNEKKAEYDSETQQLLKEHNKRLDSLTTELNKEMEIQKAHAAEFAQFANAVAEDDITRLKSKAAQERAEMEREHQERLQDIARQAQEEAATRAAAAVKTNSGVLNTLNQQAAQASALASSTQSKVQGFIGPQLPKTSQPIAGSSAQLKSPSNNNIIGNIVSGVTNLAKTLFGSFNIYKFAEGGIVSRPTFAQVGESGREAILPLNNPRRMNEVMRQAGISTGAVINAPITVVSSNVDIDMIAERLAFQMNKQGMI